MFDFIRGHQRLMQLILLILILPSFVFFGLEGYSRMGEAEGTVAKVGGIAISQQELDNAQREQMERMRQMFGPSVDPKLFDTPDLKLQTLESLVSERALAFEAARQNLTTSDEKIRQTILAIPAVQDNGAFSNERYNTLLAAQGMTPQIFEARLRRDLTLQQLSNVMQSTAFVPKAIAGRIAAIVEQEREIAELQFKPADFAAQVKVTPEMLRQYYDSHAQEFEIAQQLKIEYLVLNADTVSQQVSVTPAAISEFYEQNKKRYETPEQRRASHILILVAHDAPDADKKKARATAEEVLAKVKANPADFPALARQYSQDPGSAAKGGDLDFSSRGAMVAPFEEAVYKMREKEISGIVQTEFGLHIIQLTGIKPGVVKPLAEVRAEIEAEVGKQLATRKFAESAELFTNLVYDQSDSLKPAADRLKLTVQTAEGVTRTPAAATAGATAAPYNDAKVLAALFGDEVLKNKRNTEALEIAPNTLVSARVVENKPAQKRPFDEVRDVLTQKVTDAEARKLARQAGEARLAALKSGTGDASGSGAGFTAPRLVSRGKADGLAPDALATVFKADTSKLPAFTGQEMANGGYAIYRISRVVQPAKVDEGQRAKMTENLARQVGELEFNGYLQSIKSRAKVERLKPYDDLKAASLSKDALKVAQ